MSRPDHFSMLHMPIPRGLHAEAKRAAKMRGETLKKFVTDALEQAVKDRKGKK